MDGQGQRRDGLSSQDKSALHKLEKYGELKLFDDGFFRQPGKYWSLEPKIVQKLAELGYCRIDRVGQTTFAVFLKLPDAMRRKR